MNWNHIFSFKKVDVWENVIECSGLKKTVNYICTILQSRYEDVYALHHTILQPHCGFYVVVTKDERGRYFNGISIANLDAKSKLATMKKKNKIYRYIKINEDVKTLDDLFATLKKFAEKATRWYQAKADAKTAAREGYLSVRIEMTERDKSFARQEKERRRLIRASKKPASILDSYDEDYHDDDDF